ncbi:response regulator [Bosea sp. BK604]|uniref:response regulator n=1 Tax=Bosea sp. BK604 TaxID=2512180 RepID=UPI0010448AF6|nr:response regulator [Bosea sp. BK604]TCR64604.1 phospho-acceptor domain-containing protein [Bosea sp. BK604]
MKLAESVSDRPARSGIPSRLIALALVAIILVPGVLFAIVLLERFSTAERARYEQDAREVAQTATSILDRQLLGWRTALQTLGTSGNLRSGDLAAFYRQALLVKAFIGGDIGLRSVEGEQLLSTAVPYGTGLPSSRIAADPEAISAGRPFVSDVFVGGVVNRPLVAVVVPVTIDGQVKYLLHVSVATTVLHDVLRNVIPPDWIIGVGDKAGTYVTRSDNDEAFRGKPGNPTFLAQAAGESGTFSGRSATGDDVLVGYVRSDVSRWLIAANIKQSIIERPLQAALLTLVLLGGLVLLLASGTALWLWRLIERPLASLTAASGALGKSDNPIAVATKLREFAALRDALSSASQQIRSDSANLELRVAERTRDLEEANARLTAEIDRRARVEAMLVQAQKMEAIGNLTGGVAHDFNNLLQVIGGNLQLLSREVGNNEKALAKVERAMAGVARGAHLSSQLLAFGRRQPLEPKVVNVGRLIRGMDDLLRRTIGEAVQIETVVAGGLWNTLVDPTNLENAVLNLAINSRDAMGGSGHLTIEAGNAFLDDAYAERHAEVSAGQYVQLSVTDTGSGMTPEILEKAFEPFFSTKPQGKGTGLGLSMVFGFVKQSGGHVKVYSEPGQGTTVKLYLPRSSQAEDVPVETDTGPVVGGSETVLVVEDDEAVRDTVVATLEGLGYRVLKAPDAQSALVVIESGVMVDLLFTDVVMPGPLKSAELARKARERIPQLSVLFTSGYTENSIVHGGRLDEGVNLLSKPYSRDVLARKIRQVLARDGKMPRQEPLPVNPPLGTERALTVLVCEDDAIIRLDTADMVQDIGHIAIEAGTGLEALEIATARDIDVLLTDVGLPDISGSELATRLRAVKPDVAIIFATGHNEVEGFPRDRRTTLLKKPYQLAQLQQVLAHIRS